MRRPPLVLTPLPGIPTVRRGNDLAALVLAAMPQAGLKMEDGDIVVMAQKVVSKAEGRTVALSGVVPSQRAEDIARKAQKDPRVVELILRESVEMLRCRPGAVIVVHRLGFVSANAGIDASNVEGDDTVLLLPENPDRSAGAIRANLAKRSGKDVAVVINDSFGRAWRLGTLGTAIGSAGIDTLIDMRGRPDRNGRALRATDVGVGDELAAAASLVMGQADEGFPVVHVRGFPYSAGKGSAADLIRPSHLDLFR